MSNVIIEKLSTVLDEIRSEKRRAVINQTYQKAQMLRSKENEIQELINYFEYTYPNIEDLSGL